MEKNERGLKELEEKLPELDIQVGLETSSGDVEFYFELLKDFTELTIKQELEKYFREKDSKNYCIRIHGFKNTAYFIGAKALGDMAYEIEKLTHETLSEGIEELQRQLFERYDNICHQYNTITKG